MKPSKIKNQFYTYYRKQVDQLSRFEFLYYLFTKFPDKFDEKVSNKINKMLANTSFQEKFILINELRKEASWNKFKYLAKIGGGLITILGFVYNFILDTNNLNYDTKIEIIKTLFLVGYAVLFFCWIILIEVESRKTQKAKVILLYLEKLYL